jgi:hypothetical protein
MVFDGRRYQLWIRKCPVALAIKVPVVAKWRMLPVVQRVVRRRAWRKAAYPLEQIRAAANREAARLGLRGVSFPQAWPFASLSSDRKNLDP